MTMLRSFIERIERLKAEQDAIKEDVRDIYTEAKANGFDKTAMGQVVALRRQRNKNPDKFEERSALVDLYLTELERPEPHTHTRARVKKAEPQLPSHDADTGEIIEDQHLEAGTHQPAPPQPKPGGADGPGKFFDAGPLPEFLDQRGALQ
jgi:uncharacterized protein (UPF0335 family)